MNPKIVTIGVYGYSEEAFFKTLIDAGVDTFCDLRQRRGMRGKKYAFVNSQHLQERLEELGIRYLHLRDLAPSQTVRERQKMADKTTGISKQARVQLSNDFIEAYQKEHLATFDSSSFIQRLGQDTSVIALFCVEREPAACHRSLVAQQLAHDLGLYVHHMVP